LFPVSVTNFCQAIRLAFIYVFALGNLKLHGKLFSYADDTALITSDINWEKATQNAESHMSKII